MLPNSELEVFFTGAFSILGFIFVCLLASLISGLFLSGRFSADPHMSLLVCESTVAIMAAIPIAWLVLSKERDSK